MTENNSDENLRVNIFLQISSKFQLIFIRVWVIQDGNSRAYQGALLVLQLPLFSNINISQLSNGL